MQKINHETFEKMRTWVWRNARPLELAMWRCLFEGGSQDEVLHALSFYQNEDGGFGGGLDPDCWNPESSPYNTSFALRILRIVGFTDTAHPLCQALFRYLENTPYQSERGWIFAIPSNRAYPHAIWWEYEGERNDLETPGLTAHICGFALRYLPKDAPFYALARQLTSGLLSLLDTDIHFADMGPGGYRVLLSDIEAAGLAEEFASAAQWQRWLAKVDAEKEMFEEDDSPLLPEGVWDVPWQWYDNGKYAAEWAITKNWWKSRRCIERLLELDKRGLVER